MDPMDLYAFYRDLKTEAEVSILPVVDDDGRLSYHFMSCNVICTWYQGNIDAACCVRSIVRPLVDTNCREMVVGDFSKLKKSTNVSQGAR